MGSKLQSALRDILKGDLAVRVGTAMDSKSDEGRLLSGRATLRLLYNEFEPDGRNFDTDTLSDVYDL
eukprot:10033148-Heterocapsa_arctica.AAC.1